MSSAIASGVREIAGWLSPGRRRWRQFLRSLPVAPEDCTGNLREVGPHDFIICGCPRTGTTLLAAFLFQPPASVTVMEPWDGMRMLPSDLFRSLRLELQTSRALGRGKLDIGALQSQGLVRWTADGTSSATVTYHDSTLVGVKWPAFWRYLDRLPTARFLVTLRHPYDVVHSFFKQGGRLARGLEYETRFHSQMNSCLERAIGDPAIRRVLLFDYIHERILEHLSRRNVLAVRYERWFSDRDMLVKEIETFLGVRLRNPLPTIRQPGSDGSDEAVREAVRRYCGTAGRLGYDLR